MRLVGDGLTFLALVGLASAAGIGLARIMPWTEAAARAGVPVAFGAALGPFLVGMATVLVLLLLPGASHTTHLVVSVLLLGVVCLVYGLPGKGALGRGEHPAKERARYILATVVALWVGALLLNAFVFPLTQNDALEYATVAREIYYSRTLDVYPLVDAEASRSGFYAPWTHPPLYVAMIYLASIIQGNAAEPGLMRLVAPWFAVATVWLLLRVGALQGQYTGEVAALVLLGAPLYFFGADSGLIDALPVLGFLLVFVVVVAVSAEGVTLGALVGITLGVALWSHSEAVLFVPLAAAAVAIRYRLRSWRRVFAAWSAIVLVAGVIGGQPYLRNLDVLGSVVSDNPAVFALPELAWRDYFTIGRGIEHATAVVQYGWLKGWFALEAYGTSFWLFLVGAVLSAGEVRRWWQQSATEGGGGDVVPLALGVVACYLAVVVASTLAGIEVMIKNERYLLTVLPMVALVAGVGVSRLIIGGGVQGTASEIRMHAVAVAVGTLSLVQLAGLERYRLVANGLSLGVSGRDAREMVRERPEIRVIEHLRMKVGPEAVVLSMKPADMFWSERRMVSYLDPRLVAFYREKAWDTALGRLLALGVTHVHVVDYSLPVLYNSELQWILRRPEVARLEYQADGNQIYALVDSGLIDGERRDLSPAVARWYQSKGVVIGGRKALLTSAQEMLELSATGWSKGGLPGGLFHRDTTTVLTVGGCPAEGRCSEPIAVVGGEEYAIELGLAGHGLVRVWMQQFGPDGTLKGELQRSREKILVSEVVLGGRYERNVICRRLRMLPGASRVELSLEHVGRSAVLVESLKLIRLVQMRSGSPDDGAQRAALAAAAPGDRQELLSRAYLRLRGSERRY